MSKYLKKAKLYLTYLLLLKVFYFVFTINHILNTDGFIINIIYLIYNFQEFSVFRTCNNRILLPRYPFAVNTDEFQIKYR